MTTQHDISIDVDDLTVAEVEQLEDVLEGSLDQFAKDGAKKGKFMRALAWISVRRTNPDFTWEEAGNIRIADITKQENPTSADEQTN